MGYVDTDAYKDMIAQIIRLGQPKELGEMIARNLYSEKMMTRMARYLQYENPSSAEVIVDEMLALMAERQGWIAKKEAEQAGASYTAYLNSRDDEDE